MINDNVNILRKYFRSQIDNQKFYFRVSTVFLLHTVYETLAR